MFVGHYAVALGAKRAAPAVSLGTLFAAATFLICCGRCLFSQASSVSRWRQASRPSRRSTFSTTHFSHSLLMSLAWGAAFGAVRFLRKRSASAAIVLALVVVSHWMLDAIVHRPDLPLTPTGTTLIGLGLWNSIIGTLMVELAVFAAGVAIYTRMTQARDWVGRWGFVLFMLFLLAIYAGASFGPPSPSAQAVAWSDMGQWLVVLWAAWVDRHRLAT